MWRLPTRKDTFRLVSGYVVIAAGVLVAAILRLALQPLLGPHEPFAPFYIVVLFAAWFARFEQALFGVLACAVTASWLFIGVPGKPHVLEAHDVLALVLFVVVSVCILGMVAALRRTMGIAGLEARRAAEQTEKLEQETEHRMLAERQAIAAREELLRRQVHQHEHVQVELERAREELERQARLAAIGQIASRVAHDLRNTLGVVLNAAFLLRANQRKGMPPDADVIDMIEAEVRNSRAMINNLVSSLRPADPECDAIDLAAIVRMMFREAEPEAGSTLILNFARDPFLIWADAMQFSQVVKNLFKNSFEAAAGPVEMTVRALSDGNDDVIEIRDNGPGILPELRPRVFEPFVSTKQKGAGLGLVICHQILRRHHGFIRLLDENVNGAGIGIRLPAIPVRDLHLLPQLPAAS